jgi:hypothetical protein
VLESESVLDIHHYSLLYKPCWPCKPFASARVDHTSERERELLYKPKDLFLLFYPHPLRKSVCGQLLIRNILVLLFSFEVPLKISKKKLQQKEEKNRKKKKKQAATKKGLCVCFLFISAVVLCDYLCVQAHVSSTV